MAHSRRKFFDLHVAAKSQIAGQARTYISQLYDVERDARQQGTLTSRCVAHPLTLNQAHHVRHPLRISIVRATAILNWSNGQGAVPRRLRNLRQLHRQECRSAPLQFCQFQSLAFLTYQPMRCMPPANTP
jgi:hypothetical protein